MSETYVRRSARLWSQRAAVALLCMAGLGAGVAGVSRLPGKLTSLTAAPAELPAVPVPPAFTAPGLAAVETPSSETVAPPTPAPAPTLAPVETIGELASR